jgi:uncharacterized membrane protein
MRRASTVAPYAIAAVATIAYAAYSILRHAHYESRAFDLGILDHVVWQWSRLGLPDNPIQGFPHELGDHFSPILALLAPGYWIEPGPAAGLIGQAVLIGISIVAVERAARRRVGPAFALAICVSYALFWGIWAAVDFDFHETAFAAPLLAWALDAADEHRWRRCAFCLGALLLVKEDMGAVVAAVGVWLLVGPRERRAGLVAIAAGVAAFVLVNGVVMPAFNGGEASLSDRRAFGALGSGPFDTLWNALSDPGHAIHVMTHPAGKPELLVSTLGAFLFLSLLSPLVIITIPQLAERLLASDFQLWAPDYHYTLTIAPILAIAAADGLARVRAWLAPTPLRRAGPIALALGLVMFAVGSASNGPPRRLLESSYWSRSSDDRARDAAVAMIPRDAPVAATTAFVPHLSARDDVYLLSPRGIDNANWIAAEIGGAQPAPRLRGWRTVLRRGDLVVLKRR